MQYTYDNSAANARNPDRPPKRVRWGQNSTDEMGDLWLQVLARSPDDRQRLFADFGPKVMAEDAIGYESLLAAEPGNARLHEAAASIYLALGQPERAKIHLADALRIDPRSAEAHYNLGLALVSERRIDDAARHFSEALAAAPDHVAARVNLGALLRAQGRVDEAIVMLRGALSRDPANAAAHTNLAGSLVTQGHVREAIADYRLALATDPDLPEPLTSLAWILAASPDVALRQPAEAVRLAEHAAAVTHGQNLRVLDTLGAAYAAAGNFDRAWTVVDGAARDALSRGLVSDGGLLRERADLYRRHRPYRDPALASR
jgi:Tfp pilus assembly protein PilF